MIDPNEAPLRALPKDERDLRVTANNSHIVALDNLSGLSRGMADALCRIATGGGFSTRRLYTDDGEILFRGARPMILNGIDRLTERSDLADRPIVIELPSIDEGMRKTERELNAEFEAARPGILGALLTLVSHTLRNLPQVHLETKSRMADFEQWCEAAAPGLGLKPRIFQALYRSNRKETASEGLEGDVVAEAIQAYMGFMALNGGDLGLTGTCASIMAVLQPHADPNNSEWPTTPSKFSARLRRLETGLRSIGIQVTFRKSNGKRFVAISRVGRVATGSQGNTPVDPAKSESKDQNSSEHSTTSDIEGETQGRQGRSNSYPLLEKQEKEIEKEERE